MTSQQQKDDIPNTNATPHSILAIRNDIYSDNTEIPLVSFAVIVPMYNEVDGAKDCVQEVMRALALFPNRSALIVVDDASTDGTADELDALHAARGGFFLVHRKENGGYGAGLITGAEKAGSLRFDYVLFMDADLTNPPQHIERFLAPMAEGFDVIKGSRFCQGGRMDGVAWHRTLLSHSANMVVRPLFGISLRDLTNGFRAVRTDLFLRMPLRERGFAIIMEELYWAKKLGSRFAEVPTTLSQRNLGQRRTSFSYRPRMFADYLRYAIKARWLRIFTAP